jgi:hypothetical protein
MNRAIKATCLVLAMTVGGMQTSFAVAQEQKFQERYCSGMQQEVTMPSGARADCISEEYAIEVDLSNKWAEALGQSLHYASEKSLKAGIILVCVDPVVCNAHSYRLTSTAQKFKLPLTVWFCFPDDATLDDCVMEYFGNIKH